MFGAHPFFLLFLLLFLLALPFLRKILLQSTHSWFKLLHLFQDVSFLRMCGCEVCVRCVSVRCVCVRCVCEVCVCEV